MNKHGSPKAKWLGKVLFALSLVFLAFGLVNLGWLVWPTKREAVTINLPEGVLPGAPVGETYASLADYTLSVTWPRWLRAGGEGTIRVFLSEQERDRVEVKDRPVQVVMVEPSLSSLMIEPPGQVQASMGPGQDLELSWAFSGSIPGDYPGEVIVSFGFYDQELSEIISVPVAVVDIQVRVVRLFGFGSQLLIWFGFISLVFWGALFLWGRMVQKNYK